MKRFLSHRRLTAAPKDNHDRITTVIEGLNYDFRQFELDHFLTHVAQHRQRPIMLNGFPFSDHLFGIWIPYADSDYIAYNNKTYHIHRAHIILHEIGHMLLGHKPTPLADLLGEDAALILAALGHNPNYPPDGCLALPRSSTDTVIGSKPQEREAETFSTRIQSRVIHANRFQYLVETSTSIEGLKPYMDALGVQE